MKKIFIFVLSFLSLLGAYYLYNISVALYNQTKVLKAVVERLEADSRIAEVLVSSVKYDEETGKNLTTIKFLEYDASGAPLKPRYFTFPGNIIQFQSLVIRFDDIHIRNKDLLRGKSAYLFWKIFMLDGKNTTEYKLADVEAVPQGYRIADPKNTFEEKIVGKILGVCPQPVKRP